VTHRSLVLAVSVDSAVQCGISDMSLIPHGSNPMLGAECILAKHKR